MARCSIQCGGCLCSMQVRGVKEGLVLCRGGKRRGDGFDVVVNFGGGGGRWGAGGELGHSFRDRSNVIFKDCLLMCVT